MLSKLMIKHAAQQGGCKKLNGLYYGDIHEVRKRSKQFIWRAAVALSQTASELALQVSYLDLHVRWNEIVYPEQPLQDGNVLEAEASAFRNACIIGKKRMGKKLCYSVVFENQKHLPSCVSKKILKVEETGDKKSKNWFFEMHVPLYLIKEYEMVAAVDVKLAESNIKHMTKLPKLSKMQLQASGKNIYLFLEHKRENMGNVFCTFCQLDVSFRVAARCSSCHGYCHDPCAVGTYYVQTASRIEFLITCKRCYDIEKDVTPKNEIAGASPSSPLLSQGQESQHSTLLINQNGHERPSEDSNSISSQPETGTNGKENSKNQTLQSVDQSVNQKAEVINSSNGSKKKKYKLGFGLICKKRNPVDTGTEFRNNHILFKGNPFGRLLAPKCHLCKQPCNPELMYILCENCKNWFHADSVDLQESKVMEVFGYKCCKCRRIAVPICPHTGPDTRVMIRGKKGSLCKGSNE